MWKKEIVTVFTLMALACISVFADEKKAVAVHYLLNPTWDPAADYFEGSGKPPKFVLVEMQKKELTEVFWGVDKPAEILKASDTLNNKKAILISTASVKAYASAHWKLLDELKELCNSKGYTLDVAYGK